MPRQLVLSRIVAPLRRYVLSGVSQRASVSHGASQYGATPVTLWPALLQVAVLRGQAVLQERFFGIFLDQLVTQTTPAQALDYWQRFVSNGHHLQDFVQRIGLGTAAKAQAGIEVTGAGGNYHALFCALPHEMNQTAQSAAPDASNCAHLLALACEGFFTQLWLQQFPQEPAAPKIAVAKKDAASLAQRLVLALQRQHQGAVQLRESFKTVVGPAPAADEIMRFTLQAKLAGHWQVLCVVERPRLKTARLAAYQQALGAAAG